MDGQKQIIIDDEIEYLELEPLLIAIGSYLYNGGEVNKIASHYLEDLNLFVSAEIEKREATIH